MSVESVLSTIVERTKAITTTDKAILVLTDEHSMVLDMETIVVRGRRAQHVQEWWETRLDALGEAVFRTGESLVEAHPEKDALILASPLLVKDEPIGLLCAINSQDRPFTQDQLDFAEILSAFAASAVENARLAEQSRYVLLASERDRIAREMHDGVVQSLFSISLGLELCKKQIGHDADGLARGLEEQQQSLNTAMTELRRFIYDLRPMKLTELGFVGATEYWVREITQGRPVRGRVVVEGTLPRLTPAQEACLYRVAKEAVSNTVRHASAETFEVRIEGSESRVALVVSDDGDGFDAGLVLRGGTQGLGLKSINDRVVREGGTLSVQSNAGRGTIIAVELMMGA
jgi:signal transduction histidine kinase